jgi:molybdopterin-dependent oxidoreductase alpha subunit
MSRKPVPFRAPDRFENLTIKPPQRKAAGASAVVIAGKKVTKEAGMLRGGKALMKLNQLEGVDCPGCAWPDPDDERSALGEYCENGAKAIAEEAINKAIGAAFFAKHSIQELSNLTDYELGHLGRLAEPLVLEPDQNHYQPISWGQAFERISQELNGLSSPNQAIFYTSGRTSNEAAFLYQLLVRMYGTNNLPDCSNMCHESSGVALAETLGIGKGSVTLEDFYQTDLIFILGQNPGTNHPRMLTALEKAKSNGAKIITANPIQEAGLISFSNPQKVSGFLGGATNLTDLYLQVKINSDTALLKAIMWELLKQEEEVPGTAIDLDFINQRTEGYEDFMQGIKSQDPQELADLCGVPLEDIKQAAELIKNRPKMIVCWAMGLTQHLNAVDTIKEVVNLLLLRGSIGKPGAGSCPVRGHSNVQGDRTMGIWEKPPQWFLDKLKQAFKFDPPTEVGYDTVESIQAMHQGKARVFVGLGGNFHSATPDTDYTSQALQNCSMTVQISTKLNRSHLVTGKTAFILPCLARTDIDRQLAGEQIVSVENSMGVVHQSRGVLDPISDELKSEPEIIACLANATLGVDWDHLIDNYDAIRDLIQQVVPGFDDYNARLRQPGGFYLPNVARSGQFKQGKATFSLIPLPEHQLQEGEYLMMTIRSHDQFNTTIYGKDDRYRGIINERRVILMNPQDMEEAGLKAKEVVSITSCYQGVTRQVDCFKVVPYSIPRKNVATYFPEANPLVPVNLIAKKSQTPCSKSVVVQLKVADN